jgi:hypothetical protein
VGCSPHPAWVEFNNTGKMITDALAIEIAGHYLKQAQSPVMALVRKCIRSPSPRRSLTSKRSPEFDSGRVAQGARTVPTREIRSSVLTERPVCMYAPALQNRAIFREFWAPRQCSYDRHVSLLALFPHSAWIPLIVEGQ